MTAGVIVAGLLLATAILWIAVEWFLKATGRPLITHKVREWTRATGGLPALVFGLVVGILGGHFWFCA